MANDEKTILISKCPACDKQHEYQQSLRTSIIVELKREQRQGEMRVFICQPMVSLLKRRLELRTAPEL